MRKDLSLSEDQAWILIADAFKAQWTDNVKEVVSDSHGFMKGVPNNWTKYFQPLDLSTNRSSKSHLRKSAQTWYSKQIQQQILSGKLPHEIKVDTRISVIKPLHAKWVVQFYDYIRSHPDIVINGWKKSKIPEVHSEQIVNLDPFA